MVKKFSKKAISLILSLVMLVSCLSIIGISTAFASDFKEGTYTGVIEKESMGGITYTISAAFADGKYSYDVRVQVPMMEYDEYDDTETGTYTVSGNKLVFDGGNLTSAEIASDGKLTVTGVLSSFAFGKSESTELVWVSADKPAGSETVTYEDNLQSGQYELTEDSYPSSAAMKMAATITIDTETKSFSTQRNGAEKGTGTYAFDAATGVYTVTYSEYAPAGATVTFTYGEDGITFTSPLYFGSVRMNTLDEDGNFISYTANPVKAPVFEDNLQSGQYELTEDSYPSSAAMKMAATITIDTETKSFSTQRNGAEKGTGTYAFDAATGVYTVTYSEYAPAGATVTFTYSEDGITFTSPLYFGSVRMNTLDEDGNFISYTANPVKAPVFEDNLKTGQYELTEDSYDASAAMKMAATITIDTETKSFSTQRNGAEKGTGTYAFDAATGVYTVTYSEYAPAGATVTFTYSEDGITFTSPLYFGSVRMNVLDEDGNFIPYTAKLIGDADADDDNKESEPVVYAVLDGGDGTVAQGVAESYALRCSGALDQFVALYIDGKIVAESDYEKCTPNTTIIISADCMKALDAGEHTIQFVYTDGSAETTLTVRNVFGDDTDNTDSKDNVSVNDNTAVNNTNTASNNSTSNAKADSNVKAGNGNATSPKTGNAFNAEMVMLMMALGCASVVTAVVYKKKRAELSK